MAEVIGRLSFEGCSGLAEIGWRFVNGSSSVLGAVRDAEGGVQDVRWTKVSTKSEVLECETALRG